MNRVYQRHVLRNSQSLDGQWEIYFDESDRGLEESFYKSFPQKCDRIQVPSCWNFRPGRYEYNSVAWYRKQFESNREGNLYLTFGAISGYKQIWFDGEYVGEHYGSFTEFSHLVENVTEGKHSIVIRVDNTCDDTTLPRPFVDWKPWGGIYRPVEYTFAEDVIVSRMFIDPVWDEYSVKSVEVKVKLVNSLKRKADIPYRVYFEDQEVLGGTCHVEADGGKINLGRFSVSDIKLWAPETPRLYKLRVVCGSDDLVEQTGFRKVEVSKRRILLNGKPIKMLGINRHHSHEAHGFAVPADVTECDMDIIQNANVNSVRGSHYPNEPVVLDICDQRGLLFWEELPFWQHSAESLANPVLQQRAKTVLQEMIERDYNHPSIIFWSIQNESESHTKEGEKLFGQLATLARQLDDSRLITMATNHQYEDKCYGFVDVIGVNCYHGWYDGEKEDWIKEVANLKKHLADSGYKDMPLMITEFGASAYLGERCFDRERKYSEEFQADIIEYIVRLLADDDEIAGMYVWQFCDIQTAKWQHTLERSRCYNNKGIVNENRKPKLAYRTVKNLYGEFDMEKYQDGNMAKEKDGAFAIKAVENKKARNVTGKIIKNTLLVIMFVFALLRNGYAEPIIGGYDALGTNQLDNFKENGFNAHFRKLDFAQKLRLRLDENGQVVSDGVELPFLRSIEEYLEQARDKGVNVYFILSFAKKNLAMLESFGEYKKAVMQGPVRTFSVGEKPCPSPLEEKYWLGMALREAEFVAQLSLKHPNVKACLLDVEMYGGEMMWRNNTSFDDEFFAKATKLAGIDAEGVEADNRYNWLVENSLLEKYLDAQEKLVAKVAVDFRKAVDKVNPDIMLGLLPYEANWFYDGWTKGLASSKAAAMVCSEAEYHFGYMASTIAKTERLKQKCGNVIYLAGIWPRHHSPKMFGYHAARLIDECDGYWIYTTYSLWQKEVEKLWGGYLLQADRNQYWDILKKANTGKLKQDITLPQYECPGYELLTGNKYYVGNDIKIPMKVTADPLPNVELYGFNDGAKLFDGCIYEPFCTMAWKAESVKKAEVVIDMQKPVYIQRIAVYALTSLSNFSRVDKGSIGVETSLDNKMYYPLDGFGVKKNYSEPFIFDNLGIKARYVKILLNAEEFKKHAVLDLSEVAIWGERL